MMDQEQLLFNILYLDSDILSQTILCLFTIFTYSICKIVNKQRIVCDRICESRYKHPRLSVTTRATVCLHLN